MLYFRFQSQAAPRAEKQARAVSIRFTDGMTEAEKDEVRKRMEEEKDGFSSMEHTDDG